MRLGWLRRLPQERVAEFMCSVGRCRGRPLRPVGLAFSLAILGACGGQPIDSQQSSENSAGEAIVETNGTATTADDPFLPGNDVVVHEYGDPVTDSDPPPDETQAKVSPRFLTGSQIRSALSGRELFEGPHWSLRLAPGGTAVTEEDGHTRRGRWRVRGDELCLDDTCLKVTVNDKIVRLWREGANPIEVELR